MTPIYASNRADVAGWYAYNLPLYGRRALWDGGVGPRGQGATGFWCPYTGVIIDAPDKLLERMPNVALECFIVDDEVLVTGFPELEKLVGVVLKSLPQQTVQEVHVGYGNSVSFLDEIVSGPDLLEGTPCRVVPVEKLPDDRVDALGYFRENYRNGLARHPMSIWTPMRTVFYMANAAPLEVHQGRIREIFHHNTLEVIDYVMVWATVEKEMKVLPLYRGDNQTECPLWKMKSHITLYCVKDMVIGYE